MAAEELSSETGSLVDVPAMRSSETIEIHTIESGSVLPINENIELQNSSIIETPASITSPLLLRISEVAWMGSDLSTADEWLEVFAIPSLTGSVLTVPLNLHGWTVSIQKDTGESVIATFDQDVWIESGAYLLIANSAAAGSRLKRDPSIVSSSMSLPNTKLLIRLRAPDGSVHDTVDDFVGAPFAGLNPSASSGLPKATMERIDLRASGTDKANWKNAQTSRGFDLHSLMLGTPGYVNGSIEPPDFTPPNDVLQARAFRFSGSLLIDWKKGIQSDASIIRLTTAIQTLDLPATATGIVIGDDERISGIRIQTFDESGNMSIGIDVPLVKIDQHSIQEVLPDPGSGKEEWVELGNLHSYSLDLQGFVLESGAKRFVLSGALLEAGAHRVWGSFLTNLQLPNSGGEVRLKFLGKVIDTLAYPDVPTGISYGRLDEVARPYCVTTPGTANEVYPLRIHVDGVAPETLNPPMLNLNILALSGSLAGAACIVDFADGTVSTSCNPPSHSMRKSGNLVFHVEVKDYCDNTVIQNISVEIEAKGRLKTPQVEAPKEVMCLPSATGGVVISEFLPAPISGQEEWIELRNITDQDIDLCGWSVDDMQGGSKPYHLDATILQAHGYTILSSSVTGIALNNDADTVRLIAPLPTGGTGVLLQIPYMDSPPAQSFSLRGDGVSLWSPFLTPGTENRFVPIDLTSGITPVQLEAALPNPVGVDTWDEWVELKNMTGRPQWLNGWVLERNGGSRLKLDGKVLSKREILRLPLSKTQLVLGNAEDTLTLFDEQGLLRSVIAWKGAEEGHVIRQPDDCETKLIAKPMMINPLTYQGIDEATVSGIIVQIEGLVPAYSIDTAHLKIENNEIENLISTLIKNKKIEYKNCSKSKETSVIVDGANIAFLLLQMGLAITDPRPASESTAELSAYEKQAETNKRGIWANDAALSVITAWKEQRTFDAIVERDGLIVTSSKPSALLFTGSVISISTNVPADLWVKRGTGSWRPFAGGVYIASSEAVHFRADYTYKTVSGSRVETTELHPTYGFIDDSYPDCIRINEIYPSPKSGEHEWVELLNICPYNISLWGWTIDDEPNGGSKPFKIGTGMTIPALSMSLLSGSLLPLSLNNSGDDLSIFSPDGRLKALLTYQSVANGRSVISLGEERCITIDPTPGKQNICVLPSKIPSKSVKAVKTAIGVGSKFASVLSSQVLTKNTKNDQIKALLEGLNTNIGHYYYVVDYHSISASLLFIFGVVSLAVAVVSYCRKYRLWQ